MLRDGVITSADRATVACTLNASPDGERQVREAWKRCQEAVENIKRRIEVELAMPADVVRGKPNYSSNPKPPLAGEI